MASRMTSVELQVKNVIFLSPRHGEPDLGMVCVRICRLWKQPTEVWDLVRSEREVVNHTGQPSLQFYR